MFYVYYLIDPENKKPFYVGKGTGRRALSHFHKSSYKRGFLVYNKIKSIRNKGLEPILKYRKFFDDEKIALEYEIFLINLWGRVINDTGILFNQTTGGEGSTGHKLSNEQKIKLAESFKKSFFEKHGVYNPNNVPEIRERILVTTKNNHGSECYFNTEKFKISMEGKWNTLKINKENKICEFCMMECNIGNYSQHHGKNCYKNPSRDLYKCPHCEISSYKKANMTRYHFDNCKKKLVLS